MHNVLRRMIRVAMKVRQPFLMVAVLWLACACQSETARTEVRTEKCMFTANRSKFFIGDTECLAALPHTVIAGYWVTDHEYSVYYPDKNGIEVTYDEQAVWLNLSSGAESATKQMVRNGRRQIFEIKFVGSISKIPGVYGNGRFKSGALVDRFLSIRELPKSE